MAQLHEKLKSIGRVVLTRVTKRTAILTDGNATATTRVLFVANAFVPTLQLSFVKPLASLVASGEIATELLSEQQMKELFGKRIQTSEVRKWIDQRFEGFCPSLVVFCRYSGPHVEYLVELAKSQKIPTIFHIDDDLLHVPVEIGYKKYEYHNHPLRLATVSFLLKNTDLVYCSTESLKEKLISYEFNNTILAGKIYCSGEVMVAAENRPPKKIGYMGFDHAHDFEIVLPIIIRLLRRHPHVEFQLFGSIPKPDSLNEFGSRIKVIPPMADYTKFMKSFSKLKWDIGICPLAPTSFNVVKANTKWVEYTSVGAAVVASAGSVYDECCANDCGILASTPDEWYAFLHTLITDSNRRFQLVHNAQKKMEREYSLDVLRNQVTTIFDHAQKKLF